MKKERYAVKVGHMYVSFVSAFDLYSDNHIASTDVRSAKLTNSIELAKRFERVPTTLIQATGGKLIKIIDSVTEQEVEDD